ncbi:hypothetical protein Leryth_009855 [Lithospermum erythrorhizon]|nr:hypothetical protein Leryth_009855 [Lithospermum erythrorhizon]
MDRAVFDVCNDDLDMFLAGQKRLEMLAEGGCRCLLAGVAELPDVGGGVVEAFLTGGWSLANLEEEVEIVGSEVVGEEAVVADGDFSGYWWVREGDSRLRGYWNFKYVVVATNYVDSPTCCVIM